MRSIILFTLLLSACTKKVEIIKKNGIHFIPEVDASIYSEEEISWKVGLKRNELVSKGILFKVDIPKVSPEDIEMLKSKYGVNAWIYKVIHKVNFRKKTLGYIKLPFKKISRTTNNLTIQVMYSAAAVSSKFRYFHCPAFNHRKRVIDIDVIKDKEKPFSLYLSSNGQIRGQIESIESPPIIFDGGKELEGEFQVELALFNSNKRKQFGRFAKLKNSIKVKKEQKVNVSSCIGVKEEHRPLPGSRELRIQDFEIR